MLHDVREYFLADQGDVPAKAGGQGDMVLLQGVVKVKGNAGALIQVFPKIPDVHQDHLRMVALGIDRPDKVLGAVK